MPKTPPPSSRGGSSRRTTSVAVKKPFPWGTAIGSALLAVLLIGTLAFAALNAGSGRDQVIANPDDAIDGVAVAAKEELTQNHVQGSVRYAQTPPNGGDHNASPQQCAVYSEPIAPEHAVHSMEHAAVWVTYNDSVPDDQVEELASKVESDPKRLMSPVPEQKSPINLSAWGRRLSVDSASDERIDDFLRGYTNGRQAPETAAACIGNTATGPVQAAAPDGTILPTDAAVPPAAPAPGAPAPAASAPAAPVPAPAASAPAASPATN